MKRWVVPLLVSLLIGLTASSASGQTSIYDTLGIGYNFNDTVKAYPGDTFSLPIFLNTDSMVTGVSVIFRFNKNVLWPKISYDANYQRLLNEGTAPDSADFQASPVYDSGLWNVDVDVAPDAESTWNTTDGTMQVFYNLNNPDTARLLMTPGLPNPPNPYDKPYIAGRLKGGKGAAIVFIKFRVNPSVTPGTISQLSIIREIQADYLTTELAEEWFDPLINDTVPQTKRVIPTFFNSVFIADSADTEPGPGPTENKLPVLTLGTTQTVFDIKQGQLVSFAVSATDAEGGEVRITANNGTLPPNASLAPSNPVIGGGGSVSGTFSFRPDITQQGSFVFSFVARDDSAANSVPKAVQVNVAQLDIDVLFTSSNDSLTPEGGVPGLTEVMVPINVVSKKEIYGIQFDMDYNANNFDLDSIFVTNRIPEWVIYDNIGATPGKVRVVTFGLANDSMVPGSNSAILYMAFTVDEFAEFGGYPLTIYNAWESIDPDPGMPSLALVTSSGVLYVDRWGDVNLDRRIDVADLVNVVAYIIGNYGLSRRQFATADIIINDTVNVVDLVGIINTIFGLPVTPAPSPEWQGEYATLKVMHDEIPPGVESSMQIAADMPATVAGVELEIQYNPALVSMLPPKLAAGADGFQLRSRDNGAGMMKVLIYSSHPWQEDKLIPEGLSDIVKLPFISKGLIPAGDARQVRIVKAFVSTGAARNIPVEGVGGPIIPNQFELYQNRPNPFNPSTTIDFYLNGSDNYGNEHVTLEVFNLLGEVVKTLLDDDLPPGQHSVVWEGDDQYGQRMASGVYLYRLRVGGESQTKKMMLLK